MKFLNKNRLQYYVTHLGCIDNTPHNCDEVKGVPGVFEVILEREKENSFKLPNQGKRFAKKNAFILR
jgi:hypothetical protein